MQTSSVVLVAAVFLAVGLVVPVVERSMSYIDQANKDVAGFRNQTAAEDLGLRPEDQDTPVTKATASDAEAEIQAAQLAIAKAEQLIAQGRSAGVDVSGALSLVEQANSNLEAGKTYLVDRNYQEAYSMGQKSRMLAEQAQRAVDQQLNDAAEKARQAIESAEETIDKAEELKGSLNSTRLTAPGEAGVLCSWSLISFQSDQPPSPEDLLSQAEELLSRAKEAYNVKDFGEAVRLAEEAKKLAEVAVDELLNSSVLMTQEEALNAVAKSKSAEVAAYAKVSDAVNYHVGVEELMDQLNRASQILDDAIVSLQREEYGQARVKAIQSCKIFEIVEERADELVAEARTTLDKVQEIDAFQVGSKDPIRLAEDASGNLVVEAEKHSVTILRSHPALAYSAEGNGGAPGFEANVFGLVEFDDKDGDNEVDEGEMVKVLQLESLEWASGQQNTTRGEETTLYVWYHFWNAEQNLWIEMWTFEAPTIQHFSVGDDMVMWFVDGGAREVKLDLIIEKWNWVSPEDKLALRLLVSPKEGGVIQTKEVGTSEKWVGITYDNATVRIKSTLKALVFDRSQRMMVDVGMNSKQLAGGVIQFDFVYPNFGGNRLVHDPSLGIGGPFSYEPILSVFYATLGIAVLGLAVLASGKRLEKMKLERA